MLVILGLGLDDLSSNWLDYQEVSGLRSKNILCMLEKFNCLKISLNSKNSSFFCFSEPRISKDLILSSARVLKKLKLSYGHLSVFMTLYSNEKFSIIPLVRQIKGESLTPA